MDYATDHPRHLARSLAIIAGLPERFRAVITRDLSPNQFVVSAEVRQSTHDPRPYTYVRAEVCVDLRIGDYGSNHYVTNCTGVAYHPEGAR